jgi:hypothetical protein
MFRNNISLFLSILGNENLEVFSKNHFCSGSAFMSFRAELIGEKDKYLNRIKKFNEMDQKAIQNAASLYQEYKNTRCLIIEEEDIRVLNNLLHQLNQELSKLRKESKSKDESDILLTTKKISDFRIQRDLLIEKALNKKFDHRQLETIREAEEFYMHIHTLVASSFPDEFLDFQVRDKYVNQYDILEILQLLPPDEFLTKKEKEIKTIPAEKVFEVAFCFTEKELIALFDNKLHENTIRDGDFIRLASTDHAMFLSHKNGQFNLYNDDVLIEIKPNTAETLVANIKKYFFTNFSVSATIMPIGIHIFTKLTSDGEKIIRPDRLKLLEKMLSNRSDKNLDAQSWCGATAVWMAARYGHVDTIQMLAESHASLDMPNHNQRTPASVAARNGHDGVIKKLIEFNVDLNKSNVYSDTPAIFAAYIGEAKTIKFLFDNHADLNKTDSGGYTPLHWAIKESKFAAIKMLLECGAKINIRNNDNKLPIDYANTQVRSFYTLQILKKFIEAYPWGEVYPKIVHEHLRRINVAGADDKMDWNTKLEQIIDLSSDFFRHANKSSFFTKNHDLHNIDFYLSWFSSPFTLREEISNALKVLLEEKQKNPIWNFNLT